LWESLAIGSIPVILSDRLELPDLTRLPACAGLLWTDAVVFHPENDVLSLEKCLRSISDLKREKMSQAGMKIYEALRNLTCFGSVSYKHYLR
jgi:hypothetical protein